jgi:hypothetical protein
MDGTRPVAPTARKVQRNLLSLNDLQCFAGGRIAEFVTYIYAIYMHVALRIHLPGRCQAGKFMKGEGLCEQHGFL